VFPGRLDLIHRNVFLLPGQISNWVGSINPMGLLWVDCSGPPHVCPSRSAAAVCFCFCTCVANEMPVSKGKKERKKEGNEMSWPVHTSGFRVPGMFKMVVFGPR